MAGTKYRLSEKDIAAIERAINAPGAAHADVTIRGGEVVVYQVNSKRINDN